MNKLQQDVLGTTVIALILAVMFFVPWRVESGGIEWAPFYREPISWVRSYGGGSYLTYLEGEVAYGIMALEVLAIGALGWVGYVVTSDRVRERAEEDP